MKSVFKENCYNIDELTLQLPLSAFTIRKYIKTKKLEARKFGKDWWISEAEINRYLDSIKNK